MATFWVGGATGFLGSHVVQALATDGHDVTAVARGGGTVHGIPVRPVDVLDSAAVAASARGADGAFLATGKVSRDPRDAEELHRQNVWGTRAALAGLRAAGVRRVVVASTSGTIAIGTDPAETFDETAERPLEHIAKWPYYRSKYYAEEEALEANQPPDFEVVVVNPSLLLGPGDLRGSSTDDVRKFLEREILAVPQGGLSFVDVRDAARAMVSAFERGLSGERYLLASANMSVAAFFGRLERISGVPGPSVPLFRSQSLSFEVTKIFDRVVKAIGGEAPVDPTSVEMAGYYWYASAEKAMRELGFSPRDPTETLRDTILDLVLRGAAHPKQGGFSEGVAVASPLPGGFAP